jgi:hypothetical protein
VRLAIVAVQFCLASILVVSSILFFLLSLLEARMYFNFPM